METRLKYRIKLILRIISEIGRHFKRKVMLVKGSRFEATTYDITVEGMGILIRYYLPRGVVIELAMKGGPFGVKKATTLKGEVRYCNFISYHSYKCGVRFVDLSARQRRAIARFISANTKKSRAKKRRS